MTHTQAFPYPYALSPAMRAVLLRAFDRPGGFVCPTPGLWGAAQAAVLRNLREGGYITGGVPALTEHGRRLAAHLKARDEAPTA